MTLQSPLARSLVAPLFQVSFSDLALAVGPQPCGEKYLEVCFLEYTLEGKL